MDNGAQFSTDRVYRYSLWRIFGYRSTDPGLLRGARDPVGPENYHFLGRYAGSSDLVVACWGNHGTLLERGKSVMEDLSYCGHRVYHLGMEKMSLAIPLRRWVVILAGSLNLLGQMGKRELSKIVDAEVGS